MPTKSESKAKDALAEHRENLKAAHAEELDAVAARHERELAMASVPQKVVDGNETAALASITGQKPVRDESDAPDPEPLGTALADEKQSKS